MLAYEKLIYTNQLDESIELSLSSDFVLETFDGRTGLSNSIVIEKGVKQIGYTFISNNIEDRDMTLIGKIFDDKEDNKAKLIKVCNPLLKGTLTYTNSKMKIERSIECHVTKCIVGASDGALKFSISLTATEPFFKETEIVKELALVINLLEMPIDITSDGIEFGLLTGKTATIINEGDVQTPLIIEMIGVLTNPIVTNTNTGEYIKVNTSLAANERLLIYTAYGNKKVLKIDANGTVTNAFGLIDLSSKFFSLETGSNVITYDADSGANETTLLLHYNNQYLGV